MTTKKKKKIVKKYSLSCTCVCVYVRYVCVCVCTEVYGEMEYVVDDSVDALYT